uniref:Uncharacterized protein n=1 Tax=Rhizophora mucronata TaxID=61149 RepID=A0A2P2NPG7_RHIMU
MWFYIVKIVSWNSHQVKVVCGIFLPQNSLSI